MGWSHRSPARRSSIPTYRGIDDEKHAERMAARARDLAPALGYCTSCGVTVDEAGGKLHDWDCPDVAHERRAERSSL